MTRYKAVFYGVIILMLGYELRVVERVTLTPEATQLVAQYMAPSTGIQAQSIFSSGTGISKTFNVPPNLGWGLLFSGMTLIVVSLAVPQ
jgi:hypothetical protein